MTPLRAVLAAIVVLAVAGLLGYPHTTTEQRGYRGTGMVLLDSAATVAARKQVNTLPAPLPKASPNGPTAGESFQNVQVLGDLSRSEFARLMLSFQSWVAKDDGGCNYCHAAPDYASDAKVPKQIARAMIAMTRRINTDWQPHVAATGVTCYTCHRGKPVPPRTWTTVPAPVVSGATLRKSPERLPTPSAARSALAVDPLGSFLLGDTSIRVAASTALPVNPPHGVQQARDTYALMVVMSESLGVNCSFCHNTRSFPTWAISPPQRTTAWQGIRMARDLNNSFVVPLGTLLPPERRGPAGDTPKIYCATCHFGSSKPLAGVSMLKDYPELIASKKERALMATAAASAATQP